MNTALVINGSGRVNFNPPKPQKEPKLEGSVIVRGESMSPYINAGDYVKVLHIPDKEIDFFGHVYLVQIESKSLIARIYPGSNSEKWLLKRQNSEKFDDFEIRIEKVTALFKVTQILRFVD